MSSLRIFYFSLHFWGGGEYCGSLGKRIVEISSSNYPVSVKGPNKLNDVIKLRHALLLEDSPNYHATSTR